MGITKNKAIKTLTTSESIFLHSAVLVLFGWDACFKRKKKSIESVVLTPDDSIITQKLNDSGFYNLGFRYDEKEEEIALPEEIRRSPQNMSEPSEQPAPLRAYMNLKELSVSEPSYKSNAPLFLPQKIENSNIKSANALEQLNSSDYKHRGIIPNSALYPDKTHSKDGTPNFIKEVVTSDNHVLNNRKDRPENDEKEPINRLYAKANSCQEVPQDHLPVVDRISEERAYKIETIRENLVSLKEEVKRSLKDAKKTGTKSVKINLKHILTVINPILKDQKSLIDRDLHELEKTIQNLKTYHENIKKQDTL